MYVKGNNRHDPRNGEGLLEDVLPEVRMLLKRLAKVPANKLIYAVVKDEGVELL